SASLMPTASVSLPVLPAGRPLRLTPTDVSQFVWLEQCERYLRFRLGGRAGQKFMEEYDVIPQRITPLLSLSPTRSRATRTRRRRRSCCPTSPNSRTRRRAS